MITIVRMYRGSHRGGFAIVHDDLDEFVRKISALAGAVTDHEMTWKCYPAPEGMTEVEASRRTI